MGGLLHSARKLFQGWAPAAVARAQSFAVTCSEGHRLAGSRTAGYQALRCPTCGEGLFVLPRSPLPEPSAPSSSPAPADAARPAGPVNPWSDDPVELRDPEPFTGPDPDSPEEAPVDDGEVEWVDEAPPLPGGSESPEDLAEAEIAARGAGAPPGERRAAPADPGRTGRTTRKDRGRRPASTAPAADEPPPEPARPRVSLGERLRRNRNPLIFLGVGLLVVATLGLRARRDRLQRLPMVVELGRVEGLAALDDGKFDRAHQLLSEARRAVNELGGAVQGASAVVQGADEAAIIVGLLPSPLEDLLDEAARADPKDWPRRFDTLYKGRSVILDVHLSAVPDGQGNGRYEVDYRIFREGEGRQPQSVGRVELNGFTLLEQLKPRPGDNIRFGARLASFRFEGDEWLVGLEPSSGVIMTHQKALEALGWPSDETGGEDAP